jgi:hypothetical protein
MRLGDSDPTTTNFLVPADDEYSALAALPNIQQRTTKKNREGMHAQN